jgi:hypothetical protein
VSDASAQIVNRVNRIPLLAPVNMFSLSTAEDDMMMAAIGGGEGKDSDDEEAAAPTDGLAYLKSVRREAKKVVSVCVADNAGNLASILPARENFVSREKADIGDKFRPSKKWQTEQTETFARMRMQLLRHRAVVDKEDAMGKVKLPRREDEKGNEMSVNSFISLWQCILRQ